MNDTLMEKNYKLGKAVIAFDNCRISRSGFKKWGTVEEMQDCAPYRFSELHNDLSVAIQAMEGEKWKPIENFKHLKGLNYYVFYHPAEQHRTHRTSEYLMVDKTFPIHPRKPTYFLHLAMPQSIQTNDLVNIQGIDV